MYILDGFRSAIDRSQIRTLYNYLKIFRAKVIGANAEVQQKQNAATTITITTTTTTTTTTTKTKTDSDETNVAQPQQQQQFAESSNESKRERMKLKAYVKQFTYACNEIQDYVRCNSCFYYRHQNKSMLYMCISQTRMLFSNKHVDVTRSSKFEKATAKQQQQQLHQITTDYAGSPHIPIFHRLSSECFWPALLLDIRKSTSTSSSSPPLNNARELKLRYFGNGGDVKEAWIDSNECQLYCSFNVSEEQQQQQQQQHIYYSSELNNSLRKAEAHISHIHEWFENFRLPNESLPVNTAIICLLDEQRFFQGNIPRIKLPAATDDDHNRLASFASSSSSSST